MSYILEALRKAERERAQSQLAADATAAEPGVKAGRSRWGLVLIALLIVNATALLLLWLKPHAPEAPAVAAPAAAPAKPAPAASVKPAPAPPQPKVEEAPVVQEGVQSLDDLGAAGEEGAPASRPAAARPAEPPSGRVTIAKQPLTAERPAPASEEEPEPAAEEPGTSVAAPTIGPAPAANSSAAPGVQALEDKSAAFQATFPRFTLDVHVYDPNPLRRFVLIDGQRYREGDALPQGTRLLQIVAEGVVLDYRGEKVLYRIGRH